MAEEVVTSAAKGAMAGSWAGPIGMAAGAVLGGVGSYLSGSSSARYAERSYKHRYRWMVNDLKKAGLNPMLAVSQGPGSPPQPSFPNVGEAAVEGALKGGSAAATAELMREQIGNARATNILTTEQARVAKYTADDLKFKNIYSAGNYETQSKLYEAQLEYLKQQTQELVELTKNAKTEGELKEQLKAHQAKLFPLVQAGHDLVNQANMLGLDEKRAMSDWFKTVEAMGPGARMLLEIIRTLSGAYAVTR